MDASATAFWLYKRGMLVLTFSSTPGVLLPTRGPLPADGDPEGWMQPCRFASGQFLSAEWEPRVRVLLARAGDLIEWIDILEDRRYELDLVPPSQRARPFRML